MRSRTHRLLLLVLGLALVAGACTGGGSGGGSDGGPQGGGGSPEAPAVGSVPNPIPAENRKPGTRDWEITGRRDHGIEGFAVPISPSHGDPVTLHVSTNAPTWRVDVYRIGWYGGKGGRLVWSKAGLPGVKQAAPKVTPPIENMVETRWKPSLNIRTRKTWVSGVYLAKLRSSTGSESYVPFVVRDDRPSELFFQSAVTTWLAYNAWGGKNIYGDFEGPDAGDWNARSRVVSLDRPFTRNIDHPMGEELADPHAATGAENFLHVEINMLRFLERRGYDVTYGTSFETHARPELLFQHSAILLVGHDEYWTKEMFDNLEEARDRGVNIASFSANTGYRAVRLEPSPLGPMRRMVHYKEYTEDPLLGEDDDRVAAQWRYGPTNRPENALLGIMYACDPVDAPWVVADTSHWLFEGTGFEPGDRLPHVVGHEYDKVWREGPFAETTPENLELITTSPVVCNGEKDHADTTVYVAPSGAGVFAAGTIRWGWGLDDWGHGDADPRLMKLTDNLLRRLAAGPLADQPPYA